MLLAIFSNNTCFIHRIINFEISQKDYFRKNGQTIVEFSQILDKEVADLQVQLLDFKKVVYDSGEKLLNKLEKSSRENNNLVEWLKIYDEKIKDYEKEIYDLNLRLYFSQQHQQMQPQQQSQQQSQSPTFSSLSEYFKFHKS
ncbi:hypothetical protein RhiirA1_485280 [Rhizophagus irregularis]|uniref:Uncharacterized protein n=1 Tax=Rhizophagus irregularis TaxID=588596 RepID=A0A2N0QID1_9GLOM|nr:hypothetical protein RhiirA1_485280 [Rhizophagus irregularis]